MISSDLHLTGSLQPRPNSYTATCVDTDDSGEKGLGVRSSQHNTETLELLSRSRSANSFTASLLHQFLQERIAELVARSGRLLAALIGHDE